MSDLIKRDDAIREVSEPFDEYMWDGVLHPIRYIVDALKAVPSVDAVIVVRCKECKHDEYCCRHISADGRKPDDFCSYGERSDT